MADNTLQQELETYYRWFHQHPEPSYGEVETTTRIAAILADHGIEIRGFCCFRGLGCGLG